MANAYTYDGVLYFAVTRRCTLHCTFCPKTQGVWTVAGNDLRSDPELDADQLIAAAEAVGLPDFHRVAFVGLGEPTLRLEVVLEVGRALRARGHHVRMVTDGLANRRHGFDVTPRFAGALDEVDVSLNAPDGDTYARLCPNVYGASAHASVCEFVREVKKHVPVVKVSAVAVPELDPAALQAIRALAESLGVELRVRPYFDPVTGEPHARA